MADITNTLIGFLQIGVLYTTTLKYQLSAAAIIGIQVLLNFAIFGLRSVLHRYGITKTNRMYEGLLALVLAFLYFGILLSRFGILETIGIWVIITVIMAILTIVSLLFRTGSKPDSRIASLEVPMEPRYVMV